MSKVLVAEDSRTQAIQIEGLLVQAGFTVEVAPDGKAALEKIKEAPPDIVLTDIDMPEMDGFELVQAIKEGGFGLPVVLMTAMGSEDVALAALRKGAASYVPKKHLQRDIVSTLNSVLQAAHTEKNQKRVMQCMREIKSRFELESDGSLVAPMVNHFQEEIQRVRLCDEMTIMQINMALTEALANAIFHGNLELSSSLREGDGSAWVETGDERRGKAPWRDRKVHVSSSITGDEAKFVIRDEGPGFDPESIPDPTDPANLEEISGRGLMLIRTFMDEVAHNPAGNEITMIKRRES